MNLIEIADCLIEKIKKDYDGDVSLVHVHGSYFYNDTHSLSDLDIYFVPKTERGYKLGQTFILNGIGCDFWALSWERLERIANHEEKIVSIITDGKILYYHSKEDLERFNKLKETANNIIDKEKFKNKGKEIMKDMYKYYFKIINSTDTTEIRKGIIEIIYVLSFALAQLNCTPIKRGRKYLKNEILSMESIPEDFENIYEKLFREKDIVKIKQLLHSLILNTEKLFNEEGRDTFFNNFNGFYEEMIQSYNKIYHACETGDIYTPLFASVELTTEIEGLLEKSNRSYKLPDMIGAYNPNDLNGIKEMAKKQQEFFEKILKENGVPIKFFKNTIELKRFLDNI
jgi:predicted SnoaL-like aldol condensation-catalyzing enzyme